jgi:hypothetical protein
MLFCNQQLSKPNQTKPNQTKPTQTKEKCFAKYVKMQVRTKKYLNPIVCVTRLDPTEK